MIQIRQSKQSELAIWLDSVFAHSDGLQCRAMRLPQIAVQSQSAARVKPETRMAKQQPKSKPT
jgi:hypothetical protein